MPTDTVRFGRDTWAGSGKPNTRHNGANRLRLASGSSYTYIYLKTPVPPGQTVVSATLQVFVAKTADWTGTKTVKVRRIADDWKPGKLTWNTKPGVTGTTQPTVTVTNAADGQMLEFTVTVHLQTVSNGSSHYGWRLETDSATAHRIYGFDSPYPPRLVVTHVDAPSVPTDLVPQGGAVSVAKPYLSFSATDLTKPGEITHLQVQIDPAASTTAPGFDSGWVASSVPELDLATTAYAGLAVGASTQWRARVKTADAKESEWSAWVSFSRAAKGTITITNPAASPNNYVAESTPPILATSSVALDVAEVLVVDPADPTEVLAESGPIDMARGTSIAWSIPAGVIEDGQTYTAVVRATDTVVRVETAGDPAYVEATRDFSFQQDITVPAPGSLAAGSSGPWAVLTWQRATAPDSWTILRGGKNIAADVNPADTIVSGSTHTWRDPQARPGKTQTYEVRAVVNGRASPKSNAVTVKVEPVGIWLLDTARNLSAVIFGDDAGSWSMPDEAATYTVVGSNRLVRIVSGMRGLEGSISGVLVDAQGFLAADQEAALMKMKSRPTVPLQLVLADLSIPVEVGNLTVAPTPQSRGADLVKSVTFDFWQVGGLPFKAKF